MSVFGIRAISIYTAVQGLIGRLISENEILKEKMKLFHLKLLYPQFGPNQVELGLINSNLCL